MGEVNIRIRRALESKLHEVDFNNLVFGRQFADHMFVADFTDGAWGDFRIEPFHDFSLHPATSALHYGQAIFEGMKAELDINGNPIIFRPEKNWERFNTSAERMAIPPVSKELFMTAMDTLIGLDKGWIPKTPFSALYIRPFMFATEKYVGIRVAENYRFCIFCSPVGAYYSRPVRVFLSEKYVRAAPGGVGFAKAAGNYGAAMMPLREIQKLGYDQLLWLDGIHHKYIQEIGTMNIFFVINGVLVTPCLEQGTILAGITRDSLIKLAIDEGYKVEERDISVDELVESHQNGSLTDMFGAGTAAVLSHIGTFHFRGQDYDLPAVEERPISNKLRDRLVGIKSGKLEDKFNWLHTIKASESQTV
jgi:branched-chain amino acid aminotransferase